ncbi:MAG: hypothetical protein AVDCRST_MAG93-129 [uncultured Chloroflexia bacterium]|uniref:Uncharacterized protein n=1 Tax=uncultured Chloroflexia bacterium TaxID=1672391 RepID=A0A6J4H2V4_9CHLR|nr:MAG: hypothetical protein AVDCRST_MAG93-129 [uncultured Chloroflexia bacterium]
MMLLDDGADFGTLFEPGRNVIDNNTFGIGFASADRVRERGRQHLERKCARCGCKWSLCHAANRRTVVTRARSSSLVKGLRRRRTPTALYADQCGCRTDALALKKITGIA